MQKILLSLTTALLLTNMAHASVCPEGKEGPNPLKPVTERIGEITVNVMYEQDLSKEAVAADKRIFRGRTLTFPPGSTVELHSHDDRPETFIMLHGEVVVHEVNCTVPVLLTNGEGGQSGKGDQHWVENKGKEHAVMFVADILHVFK